MIFTSCRLPVAVVLRVKFVVATNLGNSNDVIGASDCMAVVIITAPRGLAKASFRSRTLVMVRRRVASSALCYSIWWWWHLPGGGSHLHWGQACCALSAAVLP